IQRIGTTPLLAFSVTVQLSGGLSLNGGLAGITEGGFLSSGGGTTSFQTVDNGGGSYTIDDVTLGDPCGTPSKSGTLFNLAVTSSAGSGPGSVTITEVTLRDCNNDALLSEIGTAATVAIDNAGPAVTVTSPNGGEFWAVSSPQTITWTATDDAGVTSVDIAYSTDGGATFPNVTAGHTIAASFAVRTETITASAAPGGSISPAGAVTVNCGSDQAFTITPDACHTIADVMVDGVSVGAVSSYTFTNVTAGHTIAASFTVKTFAIAASAGTGGSISPSGSVTVNCGSDQTFTITPDACHTIADVLVDGVSVGAVSSYTF